MDLTTIVTIIVIFIIVMGFYSQDKVDYFPIALLGGVIAVGVMVVVGGASESDILSFINFPTLIFIFSMQIITFFAQQDNVLEFIALKMIHFTKGDNRKFFWLICLFTGTIVAFIEDLSLSLIIVPIIVRTCKILKIRAGTYMMGMTIVINIGAILTPVSSLKNLVIGDSFGWGFGEYFSRMGLLFGVALLSTIFFLDRFIVRNEERPGYEDRMLLLCLVEPGMVVKNPRQFKATSLVLLLTFGAMIAGCPSYLAALLAAIALLMTHWKSFDFSDLRVEVEWKIIFFFSILFIMSNALAFFGFSDLVAGWLGNLVGANLLLATITTLLISSLLSAFLAGTPVTLILLPIFAGLVNTSSFLPDPIIIAFIAGVNMAGNFLPQGSACDVFTLALARKFEVSNLNYRRLLKVGSMFAMYHFMLVLGYTVLYAFMLG